MALLEVRDLSVRFEGRLATVRAVDGVSFDLEEGETLAVVGESGSGKSTLALAIPRLVPCPPGVVEARTLRLSGQDLSRMSERELRTLRGTAIAMVFQDPSASLCPWLTIGEQIGEVLEVHRGASPREARRAAAAALGEVGIAEPEARLDAFPHELSGGMRQRATIAMALLLSPRLLIADEPTSALDATVQAQVLDLLASLQARRGTAILLITHSLGVVATAADRALVMRSGRIVEEAGVRDLFRAPRHEHTRELLASTPLGIRRGGGR
jgi:ABC-type dipeptide/oligopeptide/nickel transport system ATPase component